MFWYCNIYVFEIMGLDSIYNNLSISNKINIFFYSHYTKLNCKLLVTAFLQIFYLVSHNSRLLKFPVFYKFIQLVFELFSQNFSLFLGHSFESLHLSSC